MCAPYIVVAYLPEAVSSLVIADGVHAAARQIYAGYNDGLSALFGKPYQPRPCIAAAQRVSGVVLTEKYCGFSDIRRDYICHSNQFAHALAEFARICGIAFAVITHHRVNDFQRIGEGREKFQTMVYLLSRSEKTAVNAVKMCAHALVVFKGGVYEIGEVANNELTVTRVGAQHRRRYRTDLHPHSGECGDYNCQRASAQP